MEERKARQRERERERERRKGEVIHGEIIGGMDNRSKNRGRDAASWLNLRRIVRDLHVGPMS